jgi:hypothetical protein
MVALSENLGQPLEGWACARLPGLPRLLQPVNPAEYPVWNSFVQSHAEGCFTRD